MCIVLYGHVHCMGMCMGWYVPCRSLFGSTISCTCAARGEAVDRAHSRPWASSRRKSAGHKRKPRSPRTQWHDTCDCERERGEGEGDKGVVEHMHSARIPPAARCATPRAMRGREALPLCAC